MAKLTIDDAFKKRTRFQTTPIALLASGLWNYSSSQTIRTGSMTWVIFLQYESGNEDGMDVIGQTGSCCADSTFFNSLSTEKKQHITILAPNASEIVYRMLWGPVIADFTLLRLAFRSKDGATVIGPGSVEAWGIGVRMEFDPLRPPGSFTWAGAGGGCVGVACGVA